VAGTPSQPGLNVAGCETRTWATEVNGGGPPGGGMLPPPPPPPPPPPHAASSARYAPPATA